VSHYGHGSCHVRCLLWLPLLQAGHIVGVKHKSYANMMGFEVMSARNGILWLSIFEDAWTKRQCCFTCPPGKGAACKVGAVVLVDAFQQVTSCVLRMRIQSGVMCFMHCSLAAVYTVGFVFITPSTQGFLPSLQKVVVHHVGAKLMLACRFAGGQDVVFTLLDPELEEVPLVKYPGAEGLKRDTRTALGDLTFGKLNGRALSEPAAADQRPYRRALCFMANVHKQLAEKAGWSVPTEAQPDEIYDFWSEFDLRYKVQQWLKQNG
jgi:hypothetical protein